MFASKKKKIQQYLNQKTAKTGGASPSPTQYDGVSKSLTEGAFHSSLSRGFGFTKSCLTDTVRQLFIMIYPWKYDSAQRVIVSPGATEYKNLS